MDVTTCAEALDAFVPQILEVSQTPGVCIAIGVGGEVAWAKGYGFADLGGPGRPARPMTTDTVAPTGSDCKTYTAAAAMQLVERGLIRLDEPIDTYLGKGSGDLRVVNPHGDRPITLRDLLTHRSGLGTTFGYADRALPAPLGEHLHRVFESGRSDIYGGSLVPLWSTKVGVQYQYSNTGIALVGYLVERLNPDGLTFSDWTRRHLFEPLGMASTCFPPAQHPDHVPADLLARRSVGYATLGGMQYVLPPVYVGDYPAGSALTTPSDHARFVLAVIGGGGPILRPATAMQMITSQAGTGPDPDATVGLVWNVFHPFDAVGYIGHGGEYFWGWSNFTRAWPAEGIAVVVAANQWHLADSGTSDRPSHLAGRLIGDIVTAWVNGVDPRPRESAAAARSYLAGILIADRLTTRLGSATPLTATEIAAIAGGAVAAPGTPWDPDAFGTAMREFGETDGTLEGVLRFSRDRFHHLPQSLILRQMGIPWLTRQASGLG